MNSSFPNHSNKALIDSSWSRCADSGLVADATIRQEPIDRCSLAERTEANSRLVTFSQPIMEHLYEQIDHSASMVLLADTEGFVLRAVGEGEFASKAHRVALMPGASWAEDCMGTNAIGTAIHEASTVAVLGGDHFLERNRFLTCIATPIVAPTGGMLGILDWSSDARFSLPHARALLQSTAEMIEHRLLESMSEGHLTLHFSPYREMLGSPLEAVAVFDESGAMLACNRGARRLLALSARDRLPHFERCFDSEWRRLGRLAGASQPVELHTRKGHWLAANFRLRGFQKRRGSTVQAPPGRPRLDQFEQLEHGDPRMRVAVDRARRIVDRNIPLLIQGETGSGKEWFARAFHLSGPRRDKPLVAVNCASIPATLIESELFGYAPGAFTGARSRGARGKIQEADGGTLFLDEIGDMPSNLQAVLLRVLETRTVVPLGANEEIPVDIALVCASHHPLQQMAIEGRFRADLLFRLNGLTVWLPPLRQRSDFDALVYRMIEDESPGRHVPLHPETLSLLRRQPWPGNLRQMRNVLRVALAMLGPDEYELRIEHLPEDCIEEDAAPKTAGGTAGGDLRAAELRIVRDCLERHRGNVSAAARELGITRTTLYRKLKQAGP